MNGRENSIPEKKRMNDKWVKFRRKCEFVLVTFFCVEEETSVACVGFPETGFVVPFVAAGAPFNFADATFEGRVSGKHK